MSDEALKQGQRWVMIVLLAMNIVCLQGLIRAVYSVATSIDLAHSELTSIYWALKERSAPCPTPQQR